MLIIGACTTYADVSQIDEKAAVQAWRVKHEADYRRDFVSIAGLYPLQPGPNTAGSAPFVRTDCL